MKTKRLILSLLVALMSVAGAWAQNNVIRYTATEQLNDVRWDRIDGSGTSVSSHEYNQETQVGVVTFDDDITAIGDHAFFDCSSLTAIDLPASITAFGEGAFFECSSLKTVTINSQQTLNATGYWTDDEGQQGQGFINQTFGDQVEEYILNGNITIIPERKFFNSSITNITLPETLTEIKNNAFTNSSLTSITIPASVTSIGTYSFKGCPLQSITVNATTPPTLDDSYSFFHVSTSIPVFVPEGTVDTYKAAGGWKVFTNYQVSLQSAKDVAIMMLNDAFESYSAPSIIELLSDYITQINAATSKAEVDSIYAEAINALPLAIAKLECIDAVKASAVGVVAENLQALIDGYVARINAATTVQAAEAVRDEAVAAFQLMKDKQPMIDALESKKEGVQSEAVLNRIQGYIDYISNPSTTLAQATTKYNEAMPILEYILEWYGEGKTDGYAEAAAELLGSMGTECTDCPAVEISDDNTTIKLYNPKKVEFTRWRNKE